MQKIKLFCLLVILCVAFNSCGEDEQNSTLQSLLDGIDENEFYDSDIFDSDFGIYGNWRVINEQDCGFGGCFDIDRKYDYLITKPNGIYGIVDQGVLIKSGKLSKFATPSNSCSVKFEGDFDSDVKIINRSFIFFVQNDTLAFSDNDFRTVFVKE